MIVNIDDIKYILFKDTLSNEKVACFYINNMNDILIRFESLIGINVKDKAHYKGKSNNVRTLLLNVKYNNAPLFVGVE